MSTPNRRETTRKPPPQRVVQWGVNGVPPPAPRRSTVPPCPAIPAWVPPVSEARVPSLAPVLALVGLVVLLLGVMLFVVVHAATDAEHSRAGRLAPPASAGMRAPDGKAGDKQPPRDTPHPPVAEPQAPPVVENVPAPAPGAFCRGKEVVVLDEAGNAAFAYKLRFHTGSYTKLKTRFPNVAVLLRKLGLGQQWPEVKDVEGAFEDRTNSLTITGRTLGLSRMRDDEHWEAGVAEEGDADLVLAQDNRVVLTGAVQTSSGLIRLKTDVHLPPGSRDVQLLRSPARLTFRLPRSKQTEGDHPAGEFSFEARPQVMACLAKTYGNRKFARLWTARGVFKNTGDQTLRNYRVRFRLADYTSRWGPWETCACVVPGQTVVDPYYPVFDLEKLGRMDGTCPATVEAEYEYEHAGGRKVQRTASHPTRLLGRNEVIFSSMPAEEAVDFQDRNDYGPAILASFASHQDPVIQQVAGWVSGQAGTGTVSDDSREALKFMHALYDFMVANQIAYQTPPAGKFGGQAGQHVKYPRDVLRNRAGTCVDLAIFYASVCEAVGLEPVLYLVPGHCFRAVRLPGPAGTLAPVETTKVGRKKPFREAVEIGVDELVSARSGSQYYEVDLRKLHDEGVYGLELPSLPASALSDWGVRRVEDRSRGQAVNDQAVARRPAEQVPLADRKIAGAWRADYTDAGGLPCTIISQFNRNGTFTAQTYCLGLPIIRIGGRYACTGDVLVCRYSNGWIEKDSVAWLTKNCIRCTCEESSLPGAVGIELVYFRVR